MGNRANDNIVRAELGLTILEEFCRLGVQSSGVMSPLNVMLADEVIRTLKRTSLRRIGWNRCIA